MNINTQNFEAMKAEEKHKWFDKQCDLLRHAADIGCKITMNAETVQAFVLMLNRERLAHANSVVMHCNAVATIGAALIEQDEELSRDRLRHAMEIAGDATYEMYDNAQDYYDRCCLPFPETLEEHHANIKTHKANHEEDEQKFQDWCAQNCAPLLEAKHDL